MKRYLYQQIKEDLKQKMVFVGGPRQVGKTTLSLDILQTNNINHPAYFNWDYPGIKNKILNAEFPANEKLLIFDEIHKYKHWRNLIKGIFDVHKYEKQFLITGSAPLDYYRRGGDSLQGRYHYLRLHPFSLGEVKDSNIDTLLEFGGFPEPFLSGNKTFWKRWQTERIKRVVYEDLISLEKVNEISLMELMLENLPLRVGSPLSYQSIAQDLQVAPATVKNWIEIFERLYQVFRISPFGSPKIRAIKKEQKLYFWDWSLIEDKGIKFENMVASQLLKFCHFKEDTEGVKMELRFLRDRESREVDFVVIMDKKPLFAVEAKLSETTISPNIKYFAERTNIPIFYQVHIANADYEVKELKTRVLPFAKFVSELGLP